MHMGLCNSGISKLYDIRVHSGNKIFSAKNPRTIYKNLNHIHSLVTFPTREKPNSLSRIFGFSSQIVSTSLQLYYMAYNVLNNIDFITKPQDLGVYRPRTSWRVNSFIRAKVCPMSLQTLEMNLEAIHDMFRHQKQIESRVESEFTAKEVLGL